MKVGMTRMSVTRRLNAHRALSLTLSFLALAGWGTFAYSAGSSEDIQRQLRQEVAQLTASQDQLLAERQQLQELVSVKKALSERRAKVSEASRVRVAERSSKPAAGRTQAKDRT